MLWLVGQEVALRFTFLLFNNVQSFLSLSCSCRTCCGIFGGKGMQFLVGEELFLLHEDRFPASRSRSAWVLRSQVNRTVSLSLERSHTLLRNRHAWWEEWILWKTVIFVIRWTWLLVLGGFVICLELWFPHLYSTGYSHFSHAISGGRLIGRWICMSSAKAPPSSR